MTKNDVLIGLVMATRAERDIGFDGWSSPPDTLNPQLEELRADGLAESMIEPQEHPDKPQKVFWRATAKGEDACPATITRAH